MHRKYTITSDGTITGTLIVDPDGNPVKGVTEMQIIANAEQNTLRLVLSVHPELALEIPEDQVDVEEVLK